MTANVKQVLKQISNNKIFDNELYFTGGTALAYYLNHRISEDIDIVSPKALNYKEIIPAITSLGGVKMEDENVTALRMAGLFPDEYMIKFVIDNVKLEFFQANRAIQKEILEEATLKSFENTKLKILDVKSVAKLKIVALIMREKSRDLFDFGAMIEHKIFSKDEIIEQFSKIKSDLTSIEKISHFIESKKEPLDDEAVYLSETKRVDLGFEGIKKEVIKSLKSYL
jgi:predicted nucleotidyltransferase component of viral defense system